MQVIDPLEIQKRIDTMKGQALFLHLEMTTGAYTAHFDRTKHPAATFITNTTISYLYGSIQGDGPYRVGLKMPEGWIYSEGLTHWEETENERLLLSGHDTAGKLVVVLQLSKEPF